LAADYVAKTVREHAPQFGFTSDSKVAVIR
jgi:hypothetical protein